MRKFLYNIMVFLILLGAILFTIAVFNFFIDGAHLVNSNPYIEKIANILKSGKNVANFYNCDDRLLVKTMIEKGMRGEIAVIGSSRVNKIRQYFFPDKKLLNLFVSGAIIEDYLAIFNVMEKEKFIPEMIILGLDPWILNINYENSRWLSYTDDYEEMMKKLKFNNRKIFYKDLKRTLKLDKVKRLVSITYLLYNIKGMHSNRLNPIPTYEKYLNTNVKLADGSLVYGKNHREASSEEIKIKAERFIIDSLNRHFLKYSTLNENRRQVLERFLKYIKNKKIKVIIFLTPFHPIVWTYYKTHKDCKMVLESEDYFRSLAKRYNFKIIGSFDPLKYHFVNDDFFDGDHPKEEAVYKIFKEELLY